MKPISEIRRNNLARWIDESPFSQTAIAKTMGLPSPSIINQHVRGTKAIGDSWARRYETAFGLEENWLDTDHFKEDAAPQSFVSRALSLVRGSGEYILLPKLKIDGMVDGRADLRPYGAIRPFSIAKEWLAEAGVDADCASSITAPNDDMAPRIRKGDTLILHMDEFSVETGEVYVVLMNQQVMVRRLFIKPEGGSRLVADNADKIRHPDWDVANKDTESVRILARVIATFGKV